MFLGFAALLGWFAARAPGKWASIFLAAFLALVLALGFAGGLAELLQSYATANGPVPKDANLASTEVARTQEIANFCSECHSSAGNLPRGSEAVSISGDAGIVFIPLEIFSNPRETEANEIVAYPQASGPNLKALVPDWSETDFVRAFREGKDPDGQTLDRRMPWRDIGALATDDELRAYYKCLHQ